ncbi:MAG TPA: MarR family transcriptional regulator [Parvularculaceae bacterium]|nr:MarR family transcriptional regulator [Parvularculaceae bacterium]HNS86458.1 MarR family transcriptional regulator [Parvularculaceae bacterium]
MSDDREAVRAWLSLLAASRGLEKAVDAGLRTRFGHSISRFDVLSALDRAGAQGLRAGALTEKLMVSDGATTQVTAPLIREGLVKRAADPNDGRVAIFSLTRKGEKIFADMAAEHRQWIDEAFAALTPAQMKTLRRLLAEIDPAKIARSRKDAA